MLIQAMQDAIDALRERRTDSAGQPRPTLEQRRAAFTPGDWLYPVPDDVLVEEVTAGGVPAHRLTAPGAGLGAAVPARRRVRARVDAQRRRAGRRRCAATASWPARLGRAAAMRVLFPEYRLAPEHPFPAAIDDVLAAWRWLRTGQDLDAPSLAVAGDSAGGGSPSPCSWPRAAPGKYEAGVTAPRPELMPVLARELKVPVEFFAADARNIATGCV